MHVDGLARRINVYIINKSPVMHDSEQSRNSGFALALIICPEGFQTQSWDEYDCMGSFERRSSVLL
jgi:hypothetical protein